MIVCLLCLLIGQLAAMVEWEISGNLPLKEAKFEYSKLGLD